MLHVIFLVVVAHLPDLSEQQQILDKPKIRDTNILCTSIQEESKINDITMDYRLKKFESKCHFSACTL